MFFAKSALAIKGACVTTSGNEGVAISRLLVSDCDFMNTSEILPEGKRLTFTISVAQLIFRELCYPGSVDVKDL